MIADFCILISKNKNFLMLFTALIYVVALISVFTNSIILISGIITLFLIFSLCKNYFPLKYIIAWLLIFYLGIVNSSLRLKQTDDLLNLAPINCQIEGTIVSIPQGKSEGKPKFFFNVDRINYEDKNIEFKNEKVLVTVNSEDKNLYNDLNLYNSLKLTGRLATPFKAGNPSQFDYGNYLRNHSAYAVFYAKDVTKLEKELSNRAKLMQGINNYRERVIAIHSKYLESPNLEILGGIVFGDDAVSPPKEIKQSFVNSGLLHILAASGMNVAFIYSFFFYLMSLFKLPFKLKVSLGMVTVLIYSFMTGLGASIIRATTMLLFVLLGKLIDRDAHSISLLSFVALLMLIYNPLFISDIGFQLSFIVTFGILFMSPLVIRFNNKIKDFIAGTIAIPIIAQLWVIPIQIFYFSNISLYSIFANIMSVPILMVISSGGFISSLLSAIKPLADKICLIFDFILNPFLNFLVNISDFWGHLPNSAIQTTHPAIFQIILYYLCLIVLVGILNKDLREKYLKPLLITFFTSVLILLITLIPIRNSNLEIITFDVGNADCFLIKTPKNEYIMIDTGKNGYNGGKSQAEIIVLKYLKDRGIKELKTIIVTHFDNDHCGGAVDLLNNLKVDEIYVNDLNHNSIAAQSIYKTASENKTKVILSKNQQVVYDKELLLTNFVAPSSDDDNENSILTLLTYKDFSMLFTGDASINGIKSIIKNLPQNITVLKVPHHGAIGGLNKEILSYLNPKYSIISVGENRFGHPSLLTLKLLENTNLLRTDIHNSIKITVNKRIKIFSYNINKHKYKLVYRLCN